MLDKYDFDFEPNSVKKQGCTQVPNAAECAYDCAYPDSAAFRKCPACPRRQT